MDYPDPVKEALTQGSWKVGYFFADRDQTSTYSGYTFSFNNNGALECTSANGNYPGSWQLIQKVAGPAINIQLNGSQVPLTDMNNVWNVITADPSVITLKNTSGTITFQKN
jgi:hypothetical protein